MQNDSFGTNWLREKTEFADKEMQNVHYPDSKKFKTIYILCSWAIIISVLIPIVRWSHKLDFFWSQIKDPNGYIIMLIPLAIGFVFFLIGLKLRPPTRSKVYYYIFVSSISLLLIILLFTVPFSKDHGLLSLYVFFILILITPIGYYSLSILATKNESKSIKFAYLCFSIGFWIIFFVPIVRGDRVVLYEIFKHEENIAFILPVSTLFVSNLIAIVIFFKRNTLKLAKINTYLIKGALFVFPFTLLTPGFYTNPEDYSVFIKITIGIYGLFFLICYSFVEHILIKLSTRLHPFANPVLHDYNDDNNGDSDV